MATTGYIQNPYQKLLYKLSKEFPECHIVIRTMPMNPNITDIRVENEVTQKFQDMSVDGNATPEYIELAIRKSIAAVSDLIGEVEK